MKIVLLVVGPLFIAVGLFWFGQGTGLLAGAHNAVLIDAGAGRRSLRYRPCLVRIAVAGPQDSFSAVAAVQQPSEQRRTWAFLRSVGIIRRNGSRGLPVSPTGLVKRDLSH